MRNSKLKMALFTITEYEKEQDWLIKQHSRGWKLNKAIAPCFYSFERCEPEEVIYQLDYNQEGQENKSEYVQMFEDCGWEYITDMVGYSYFRKSKAVMKNEEEIFCDDASRIDMFDRVFKGRMIPLLVIMFLIIIPQSFLLVHRITEEGIFLLGFFIGVFIIYVNIFVQFAVQYFALKKRLGK